MKREKKNFTIKNEVKNNWKERLDSLKFLSFRSDPFLYDAIERIIDEMDEKSKL